ncbi:MAG: hypothetical protein PUF97_05520 [Bifidobacteriaceae bacterium]|nr:hypothetical protein [Bifidobacteriaceae bacterium]
MSNPYYRSPFDGGPQAPLSQPATDSSQQPDSPYSSAPTSATRYPNASYSSAPASGTQYPDVSTPASAPQQTKAPYSADQAMQSSDGAKVPFAVGIMTLLLEVVAFFTPYYLAIPQAPSPFAVLHDSHYIYKPLVTKVIIALIVVLVLQVIALALRNGPLLAIFGLGSSVCHGLIIHTMWESDSIFSAWVTIEPMIGLGIVAGLIMAGVGIAMSASSHRQNLPPAANTMASSNTSKFL